MYGFTGCRRGQTPFFCFVKGESVLNVPVWGWGWGAPVLWGFSLCCSPWSRDLRRSRRRTQGKHIGCQEGVYLLVLQLFWVCRWVCEVTKTELPQVCFHFPKDVWFLSQLAHMIDKLEASDHCQILINHLIWCCAVHDRYGVSVTFCCKGKLVIETRADDYPVHAFFGWIAKCK